MPLKFTNLSFLPAVVANCENQKIEKLTINKKLKRTKTYKTESKCEISGGVRIKVANKVIRIIRKVIIIIETSLKNVANIIKEHNSKVLRNKNDRNNHKCNWRSKPNCPLNGECLALFLVHKITSSTSSNSFAYHGTSEVEFKTWYHNHAKLFRHHK